MRAKFLADANFDLVILVAAKRRELTFDYQTALEAGLTGQQDLDVLAVSTGGTRPVDARCTDDAAVFCLV